MTLTDFLLARIAEDEAAARSAEERAQTPWRATYGRQVETSRDGYLVTPEDEHSYSTDPPDEVALHIARHDPGRVLAECEAKRRAIDSAWADHVQIEGEWGMCQSREQMDVKGDVPDVVAHLAAIYRDHPDYRDEWKP